jgi:hypothetical protein
MTQTLAVAIVAGCLAGGPAADAKGGKLSRPEAERLGKLIEQLASPKYKERHQATREIEKFGLPALGLLDKAAQKPANLEMERRLGLIIWKLRAPARAEEARRIAAIIPGLGSARFEEREATASKLEAIGRPALAPLYEATLGSDVEVTRRAEIVIQKILARNGR